MNESGIPIIAIDIPSGLMGEDNSQNDTDSIIKASFTLTLQFPKLSFFFAENEIFTGSWEVLPIGIHPGRDSQNRNGVALYRYGNGCFAEENKKEVLA